MATLDIDNLAETMSILSDADLQSDLESLYDNPEDFRAQVQKLTPSQISVLVLTNGDITELKSYASPPAAVKDVLEATYLLLGHNATDFKSIKKLMGLRGTASLKIQIAIFDQSKVNPKNLEKARELLGKYNEATIMKTSCAAGTIYQWAANAIQDIDGHQSTKADQAKHD